MQTVTLDIAVHGYLKEKVFHETFGQLVSMLRALTDMLSKEVYAKRCNYDCFAIVVRGSLPPYKTVNEGILGHIRRLLGVLADVLIIASNFTLARTTDRLAMCFRH